MNPCDMPCCRCGSTQIDRLFLEEGKSYNILTNYLDSRLTYLKYIGPKFGDPYPSPYIPYQWKVLKNCIYHKCKVCKYDWDSLSIK